MDHRHIQTFLRMIIIHFCICIIIICRWFPKMTVAKERYLVIGGGGFLGKTIADMLADRGDDVTVFDLRFAKETDARVKYIVGDITRLADVELACASKSVVIHTASPIHGKASAVYFKVNVEGTSNVIAACSTARVQKLIYTSSAGVIYNGQDLLNANESTPYCKVHMDAYNESKAIAELAVLKANDPEGLLTCALRPSGIFGPRDSQGSLSIVEASKRGQWRMMIGDNTNLFDMTYVDNAAYAHVLAADKLSHSNGIGGEAFTITNDQPVFFWDFPMALYHGLGYKQTQKMKIPTNVGYLIGALMDTFAYLLSPFWAIHPSLSVFRVKVISANRYFDISKAKDVLGYRPIVSYGEAIDRTVEYWKSQGYGNQQ